MPTQQDSDTSEDDYIFTALRHDDSVFASTLTGLYRAALSDKVWHKVPLPDSAPIGGYFAREEASSSLVVYYQRNCWPFRATDGKSGLWVSKDSGQTWELTAANREFGDVFIQSDGDLYACEQMLTPEPPPNVDKESLTRLSDGKGRSGYSWYRYLVSHDLGKTWRDLSEGLSPACSYSAFRDPAHPGLIRLMGVPDHISVTTERCFEADDQNYRWKEISWEKWHSEPVERKDAFGPGSGGSDDLGASAHLCTLFKYPFLKWGNGLSLDAIQIEAESPTYTFRQHEPMPVALEAYLMFPHKPVQFVDNEDETVCWALYGYPDGGGVFQVHGRAHELSVSMDDHEAELATLRDNSEGSRPELRQDF